MEIIRKEKSIKLKVKIRELVPVLAEMRVRLALAVPGVPAGFDSVPGKEKPPATGRG